MTRIPFSILDLSPIGEGETPAAALGNTRRMAIRADEHGFKRFWLAEHHGMPGIASAATAVVIGHAAQVTRRIRVGSGGVMLPNHSPLTIAEQFGTLEALFPGRIDLGVGRAPGTDMRTARALRRNLDAGAENFPHDLAELARYLGDADGEQPIQAIPGKGSHVPMWLLGSSLYSAHLAAALGLPYAFASHFAPDQLMDAITIYRERFQPSRALQKPYVMAGIMGVAAETDEEAQYLFTSAQQQFVNLRRNVRREFPRPVATMNGLWSDVERYNVEHALRFAAVGDPNAVALQVEGFLEETAVDELIISMPIHSIEARLRSMDIFAGLDQMMAKAA